MLDRYVSTLVGSIPYLLFLVAGVWLCVLDNRRNPRGYNWAAVALVAALCSFFLRPWIPYGSRHEWGTQAEFHRWDSFAHSLLDAAPIGLLLLAVFKSTQSHDDGEPAIFRLMSRIRKVAQTLHSQGPGGVVGAGLLVIFFVLIAGVVVVRVLIASFEAGPSAGKGDQQGIWRTRRPSRIRIPRPLHRVRSSSCANIVTRRARSSESIADPLIL